MTPPIYLDKVNNIINVLILNLTFIDMRMGHHHLRICHQVYTNYHLIQNFMYF